MEDETFILAWNAASAGDLPTLKALVKDGFDINSLDDEGSNVLLIAAQENQYDTVEWLTNQGIALDLYDKDELSPINQAAANGHIDIIKFLLEEGVSPNATFPLHTACTFNQEHVIKHLLSSGADINRLCTESKSPLTFAAANGHSNLVKFLLSRNPDLFRTRVFINEIQQETFLGDYFKKDILNALFKQIGSNKDLFSIALNATGVGDIDTLKILIDIGFDINSLDEAGRTILDVAVQENQYDTVVWLEKNGHSLDIENNGTSPINQAAANGYINIVKFLLEKGVDPNLSYPLHMACSWKQKEIIKLLISYGADINLIDDDDYSPLTLVATQEKVDIFKFLLSLNADTENTKKHIKDIKNKTILNLLKKQV
jgi:ankyrin repeat protein